jgi:predicted sulfurtransferase
MAQFYYSERFFHSKQYAATKEVNESNGMILDFSLEIPSRKNLYEGSRRNFQDRIHVQQDSSRLITTFNIAHDWPMCGLPFSLKT